MRHIIQELNRLIKEKEEEIDRVVAQLEEDITKLVAARDAIEGTASAIDRGQPKAKPGPKPKAKPGPKPKKKPGRKPKGKRKDQIKERAEARRQAANSEATEESEEPKEAKTKRTRKHYSKEFKLKVLETVDKMSNPAVLLKKYGLYPSHIHSWRSQKEAGKLGPSQGGFERAAFEPPAPPAAQSQGEAMDSTDVPEEVPETSTPAEPEPEPAEPEPEPEPAEPEPEEPAEPEQDTQAPNGHPRAKTLAQRRRVDLPVVQAELPWGETRPRTRAECENRPRPCPWVSCKYHLFLDVNPVKGSIRFNLGHAMTPVDGKRHARVIRRKLPTIGASGYVGVHRVPKPELDAAWARRTDEVLEEFEAARRDNRPTCVLDVVEESGALSLDQIGGLLGLTRERVRQIEVDALLSARSGRMAYPDLRTWEENRTDDKSLSFRLRGARLSQSFG
jgi:transposase-like protein